MGIKNFEKNDNVDKVEAVDNQEKNSEKDKESMMNKVKDFFAGKNKEDKEREDKEEKSEIKNQILQTPEDKTEKEEKTANNSFDEKYKLDDRYTQKISEAAKEYREKNNFDEHGNKLDNKNENTSDNPDDSDDDNMDNQNGMDRSERTIGGDNRKEFDDDEFER